MAGDEKGLAAAIDNARRYLATHPGEHWFTVETLLLVDRRADAEGLLEEAGHHQSLFDLLRSQGRFVEAIKLSDTLDPEAVRKPNQGDAQTPREFEEARRQQVAEVIGVRAEASKLLWTLGEADRARTSADAAAALANAESRRRPPELPPRDGGGPPRPLEPNPSPWVWRTLAATEQQLGRRDRAVRHVLRAIDAGPAGVAAIAALCTEAQAPQAEFWWALVARRHPHETPAARLKRVMALLDAKAAPADLPGWLEDARRIVMEAPQDYGREQRAGTLADILLAWGLKSEAEETLAMAARSTKSATSYRRLADIAADAGDWRRAAGACALAMARNAIGADVLYLRGLALTRLGRVDEGSEALRLAEVLPLADEHERLRLSDAMRKRGDSAGAARQIEWAARICTPPGEGSSGNARRQWALALAERGDYLRAADEMERSVLQLIYTNSSFTQPSTYLLIRHWVHTWRALGLLAKAVDARDADRAASLAAVARAAEASFATSPVDTQTVIHLVGELDRHGHRSEADAVFRGAWDWHQRLIADYPRHAAGVNAAAWLAARCNRNLDAALAHAQHAVAMQPRSAAFIDTLAEVLYRLGRRDEAIQQMRTCLEIEPANEHLRRQMERFLAAPATHPATAPAPERPESRCVG